MTSEPAGWYPDPGSGSSLRYWDGFSWTGYMAPSAAGTARREDWSPLPFPGTRAGFGRRVHGFVVDSLLVTVPLIFVFFGVLFTVAFRALPADPESFDSESFDPESFRRFFVVMIVVQGFGLIVPLLYKGLLVADGRRTVGHRVAGIRVVDARTGAGIPLGRAFLRAAVGTVASGQLFGLGYLWALWDSEHRTWHDIAAGTTVIDTRLSQPG